MFKPSVMLGGDPEIFCSRGGLIIGSEKVIPAAGLYNKALVIDGVQLEFNPRASFNRADLTNNLKYGFKALALRLKELKDVEAVFTSVVDVTREELDSLSDTSRIFGCAPSHNIYGSNPICVDPTTYLKRAAGGHIHLGLTPPVYSPTGVGMDERTRLTPLLDIILGNTCVLIDREEGQVERRKYYGRAGEFRLPKHGLEYRTPSNFWLRHAILTDLVMGLAYGAVEILGESLLAENDPKGHQQLEDELVDLVDIGTFISAINTNNVNLAWKNWDTIRPFLVKNPISILDSEVAIEKFERFARGVQLEGLEKYFPENPLTAWCNLTDIYAGWAIFSQSL